MWPLISVIVPVYNRRQYISDCLESILNQTYKNIEVIIVDDGSADGSLEICTEYSKKDSRIVVVQKEHAGSVEARKTGAARASGVYCTYVDSDDWIADNLIETALLLSEDGSVDIINYNMSTVLGDKIEKWRYTIPDGVYECERLKDIYPRMMFDFENGKPGIIQSLCTKLIKRSILLESMSAVDSRITLGDDAAVVYKAMLIARKVVVTNENFYYYRVHSNSLCTSKNNSIFLEIAYFQQYMQSVFDGYSEEYGLDQQLKMYMHYFIDKGLDDFFSIRLTRPYAMSAGLLQVLNGKVALYGAGKVGRAYYRHLIHMKNIEIVAWLDKEPEKIYGYGYKIQKPDYLKAVEFDQILIAVGNEKSAEEIRIQLHEFALDGQILWEKPQNSYLGMEIDGI